MREYTLTRNRTNVPSSATDSTMTTTADCSPRVVNQEKTH